MLHLKMKDSDVSKQWTEQRKVKEQNGSDTTGGADQYLSSLLQLAFVISKLLLKTDLLKRGRQKTKRQTEAVT